MLSAVKVESPPKSPITVQSQGDVYLPSCICKWTKGAWHRSASFIKIHLFPRSLHIIHDLPSLALLLGIRYQNPCPRSTLTCTGSDMFPHHRLLNVICPTHGRLADSVFSFDSLMLPIFETKTVISLVYSSGGVHQSLRIKDEVVVDVLICSKRERNKQRRRYSVAIHVWIMEVSTCAKECQELVMASSLCCLVH